VTAVNWTSKLPPVVGAKAAKKLQQALGLVTVGDLLRHYPRAWVERGGTSDLSLLEAGEQTTVIGRVRSSTQHPYQDRRTGSTAYRLEVVVEVGEGRIFLTFFDRRRRTADWRVKHLGAGKLAMFAGRADWDRVRGHWQLLHPHCDILDRPDVTAAQELLEEERRGLTSLRPIYPVGKDLTSWVVEDCVRFAMGLVDDVPEPLPAAVRLQHGLLGARQALEWVHAPASAEEKDKAVDRLRFEEAFITQTVLAQRRAQLACLPAVPRSGGRNGLLDRFDGSLPFELTHGQRVVSDEILADLSGGHPMHRLLQGEVGSGKTVVALRAMLRVVDSGGQAALLAPTEVLAQQHHRSISAMLGDLAAAGMLGGATDGTRVALLTGSLGATARRAAMGDVASGAAGIVVGTHALLEEKVRFADLALVVVDEQHRFGVEQRAALTTRSGEVPAHVLVMTATPIPRTVAMTVFGDLETSTLTELPAGRAPVRTHVVAVAEHPQWLERAWARICEEVEQGHQAYVVCPRIAGDDGAGPDDEGAWDEAGKAGLAAVEEVAPALAEGPLSGLRVEALHGRLAPEHKEATMRAFAAGTVDVLVSTTVVEVGVDVPNATVMVILDAERFGVSQLHQLRGRIGRGGLPGLCLLVTGAELGTAPRARVEAVAGTLDGFELSRLDLEQRREGDVLGSSQSGRRSGLRLLSVLRDEDVITAARHSATELVSQDPDLVAHPALLEAVRHLAESEQAEYLDRG
jgi:ATP-dependent DNA helicase RecG